MGGRDEKVVTGAASMETMAVIMLVVVSLMTSPVGLLPSVPDWGLPTDCAYVEGMVDGKTVEGPDHVLWVVGSADNGTPLKLRIYVSELIFTVTDLNSTYHGYTCEMKTLHDMIDNGTVDIVGAA